MAMKKFTYASINRRLLIRYSSALLVYFFVVALLSVSIVGVTFFILFQIPLVISLALLFKDNPSQSLMLSKSSFNFIKFYGFFAGIFILYNSSILSADVNLFEFGKEVAKNRYEEPSDNTFDIGYLIAAFSSSLCLLPLLIRIDDSQADKILKFQMMPLVLYAVVGSAKYVLIIPFFSYIFWTLFVRKRNNATSAVFKLMFAIAVIVFVQFLRYGDQAADLIVFIASKLVYGLFNAIHLDAWLLRTPPSLIEFNFQNIALGPASVLGLAERGQGVWDTVESNGFGDFNIYTTCRNWLSAFGLFGLLLWYIYVAFLMVGSTLQLKLLKYLFRGLLIMEFCFFPLVSPMTYNFNILVILFAVMSIYFLGWIDVRSKNHLF